MPFPSLKPENASEIEALFDSVFSESAGPAEGALIGGLAKQLAFCIHDGDVCGFSAVERDQLIGAVFFSRLTFDNPLDAYILAPMAVDCDHQGAGVGKALITHGLHELAGRGVRLVVTYGDPAFYAKVGFRPISPYVIQPPYELSQPEGWLGQSLGGESLQALAGRCSCVKALRNQAYW